MVLVDLVGTDKMTNSLGILIMFEGFSTALGPPLAGSLYDISGSYVMSFLFTGMTIVISGAMCMFIPCIKGKNKQ